LPENIEICRYKNPREVKAMAWYWWVVIVVVVAIIAYSLFKNK
jgi:hypothetical protein